MPHESGVRKGRRERSTESKRRRGGKHKRARPGGVGWGKGNEGWEGGISGREGGGGTGLTGRREGGLKLRATLQHRKNQMVNSR